MKKFVVLSFIQLFFTTVVLAQAQIGSFYGLRLGMTISEVRSALSSQGKTMDTCGDGYIVKNVKLGDSSFESLLLKFENSKMTSGKIYSNFNRIGALGGPDYSNGASEERAIALWQQHQTEYKKIFNAMRLNLIDKYGSPRSDNDDEIIWRKGSSQITLCFNVSDGPYPDIPNTRFIETEVSLTYKIVSTNVNY